MWGVIYTTGHTNIVLLALGISPFKHLVKLYMGQCYIKRVWS